VNQLSPHARTWLIGGLAVVVVLAIGAWFLLPPRALSFAGGRTVSLTDYKGPSPVGVPVELRSADLVTRGRYLTQAADCEVCHTREGGEPFAGGRAFKTPFGVLYSPNITADRETGIGAWTDADFLRAVHKGIAKDGERLYPAFPYDSYTLIADDDVLAIKAYLFGLPVVHATAPANSLRFPFNQRWLMGIWAAFYNPDHRFRPHEDRSADWNRGAYLAEALTHCGDCHTPRNLAQALDNRRKFAGAVTAGWRAYNITADPVSGIGGWSDAELTEYLRSGHAAGRGLAGGPMAEEIDVSTSMLTGADRSALITYLRSIPPLHTSDLPASKTAPASDSPESWQAGRDPRGRQIFEGACESCHGWSGVSLLTNYATLTGDRAVNDPSAINVAQIVLSGERRHTSDGVVLMPSFGDAYSDTEIAAVANYVTARFGAVPSHLTAEDVAGLRKLSSH
jgi:mono/diheme cytochrome c family protein